MRKTIGASKAARHLGYCRHLRPFGKRLANKATRQHGIREASMADIEAALHDEREEREDLEFWMEYECY